MELSKRKREVLAAVTKAYIATGLPVGSKTLVEWMPNAPSSATLRNEMSELCDLGLLAQPHTSAGRVPTDLGIKLYVETLMPPGEISPRVKQIVDSRLSGLSDVPEKIPALAGEMLSELTGLPAITCFSAAGSPRVRKVELLPIGKSAATVLLVSSDGRVRHRTVRSSAILTPDRLTAFQTVVRERVLGKRIEQLNRASLQGAITAFGMDMLDLTPLLAAVFEMAAELETSGAQISGVSLLYRVCGSEAAAKRMIALAKQGFPLVTMMEGLQGDCGVILGRETGFDELRASSIVAAKYRCADQYQGVIGVIGRNRMSYENIIPCVQYCALRLAEAMGEAQKDMED